MTETQSSGEEASTRAVIVQVEPVHEEVIPSLRHVLERNGVSTTIVLDERTRDHGDLFAAFTDYAADVHYLPLTTAEGWDRARPHIDAADLVVFNTFQFNGHARQAREFGKPTLGIVHNPPLFVSQQECVDFARSGQLGLLTLAPHATSHLISEDPELYKNTATIGCWMFELPAALRQPLPARPRVTIPGSVDFRNRDYRALLARLRDLVSEFGEEYVEIAITAGGPDHQALRELVREQGLEATFTFSPVDPASGYVRSEVLYPELAASTFLLPMLPESRQDYRRFKITQAISSSVGYSVPSVLDHWTATVYGVPCVQYRSGEALDGLARALALPEAEVAALRHGLDDTRSALQERSVEEMRFALDSLASADAHPVVAAKDDPDDREPRLHSAGAAVVVLATLPGRLGAVGIRVCDRWLLRGVAERRAGVGYSNSYLLERLGWRGIVAEPNPAFATELRRNRCCNVSTKCVFDSTGDTVTFHAVQDRPALSTIEGFGTADAPASVARTSPGTTWRPSRWPTCSSRPARRRSSTSSRSTPSRCASCGHTTSRGGRSAASRSSTTRSSARSSSRSSRRRVTGVGGRNCPVTTTGTSTSPPTLPGRPSAATRCSGQRRAWSRSRVGTPTAHPSCAASCPARQSFHRCAQVTGPTTPPRPPTSPWVTC